MFDFVRKHTKLMMGALFLLVIPAFVLVGVNSYTNGASQGGKVVASVAGDEIRQGEWDAAHQREVERIRASSPAIDLKLLDAPAARAATLDRLVRERVLRAAAEHDHLLISDARLARALREDPSIAALRRPDGTLDMQSYRQLLASQGMTPELFEARVRADLASRQVVEGVAASAFMPQPIADVALNALFEQREVQVAEFRAGDFSAKVEPTDEQLQADYRAHPEQYRAPESVDIEYVVLDLDAAARQIDINDAELKGYYDQNTARFETKPERRASHILITSPKTAPAAERAKARAEAERLLAEARKPDADFAALAKASSQDPGSAAEGGDLGLFGKGAMVKPFEDAAFALEPGMISEVVESDFGYHIIKVTEVKAQTRRSFEQVRPELEKELKTQAATRKFADMAETFSNVVYEQSDSLKPVAERLKLEVRNAAGITPEPAAGAVGVLANPKFLSALFRPDVLRDKRNTEALDLGGSRLASARVVKHEPARVLPFDEVKQRVRAHLVGEGAAELARQQAQQKLAAWKADPAQAQLPAALTVSRTQAKGLPAAVVDAALSADPAALPLFVGVDLGAQGYAVLRVLKQVPREAAADAVAEKNQLMQSWAGAQALAYYDVLRQGAKVSIVGAAAAR